MSTELAIQPEQTGFTDKQVAALRSLGVEDAPPGDVALLFHQSVRTGLDPFLKQIYLIGRTSRENVNGRWVDGPKKWTIQTGIDGFRVIRDRSGTYDGQEVAWCGPDGRWRDVWTAPEPPFAARVLVYVKGRSRPEPGIAYFAEYAQTDRNGNPQAMWKTRPAGQLAKCAEALALRKAYPQDLSGIYTDDEMQQAENGPDGVPAVTKVQPAQKPRQEPKQVAAAADLTDEDRHAIADEFAVRSRRALTVTDARDLYREAAHRGILGYPLTTGELLEDVLRARGEHLADEEAHPAEDLPLDLDEEEVL